MKIVVSACLLGENCKYNGGNNYNEKVLEYIKGHEVISVCPELMGGLLSPRDPAEIVDGIVKQKNGVDVDVAFRKGAEAAVRVAVEKGAELAILQPRSPSCGSKMIYDGTFSGKLIPGEGVFAKLLRENGIKVIDTDDI